jgi:uncharacterized alpha-E superfamily protein
VVDESATCRTLLSIMGVEAPEGPVTTRTVLEMLAFDPQSPASIASGARRRSRERTRARETLSEPLWESINTTYAPSRQDASGPSGRPASSVGADRAALVNGMADATMTRDEGWQFLVLGRSIERADMTARLVATAASPPPAAVPRGTATLRACGAYEAFLRTYRGLETDREAAEFLLLDRLFPRSIVHALSRAELCLTNLESGGQRAGFQNDAQRLIGRTRANLEYRALADLVVDLPHQMELLQQTCAATTQAVDSRYFAGAEARAWQGGRV